MVCNGLSKLEMLFYDAFWLCVVHERLICLPSLLPTVGTFSESPLESLNIWTLGYVHKDRNSILCFFLGNPPALDNFVTFCLRGSSLITALHPSLCECLFSSLLGHCISGCPVDTLLPSMMSRFDLRLPVHMLIFDLLVVLISQILLLAHSRIFQSELLC